MDHPPPAIRVAGLVKRFGDVVALDGIDLTADPGTVLGVLGPNGAGKTTAVRVLTTVLRADEGEAEVLGFDVARDANAVRARIGLAGQFATIDPILTGRENLHLIARLTHVRTDRIAHRSSELIERFGLADAADRHARTYSGGMRRRLDLAAALVHRPPVLFLDEPTTGLDPQGRQDLWGVIEELAAEGTTLLLTTQYLEEADRLADNVVVIDHGRVIAEGSPTQLKARLGGTVIEVGFADDSSAERAVAALAPFGVRAPERNGLIVTVEVPDGPRTLVAALRALDGDGLSTETIEVREPSLDDVFLSLTGRPAEAVDTSAETLTRGAA